METLNTIAPRIRLSLYAQKDENTAVFGRGVAQLCRGIQEEGSLNKAAKSMGMAYSKAWRIIKITEETFGFKLLDRNGAHGSALTPNGRKLLESYNRLEEELQHYAADELAKILGEIESESN